MSSDEVEEGSTCFFCGVECDSGNYCYGCDSTVCDKCDLSNGRIYGKHLVEDHQMAEDDDDYFDDEDDDDDWSWVDDIDEEDDDLDLDFGDEDEDEDE